MGKEFTLMVAKIRFSESGIGGTSSTIPRNPPNCWMVLVPPTVLQFLIFGYQNCFTLV
jgi:hypothetical protein